MSGIFRSAWNAGIDKYTERIYNEANQKTYDLNGNIQGIMRYGLLYPNNTQGAIDRLQYYYDGNKIVGVDDAVKTNNTGDFFDNGKYYQSFGIAEYTYDANGNLVTDNNKEIIGIIQLSEPGGIIKQNGYLPPGIPVRCRAQQTTGKIYGCR